MFTWLQILWQKLSFHQLETQLLCKFIQLLRILFKVSFIASSLCKNDFNEFVVWFEHFLDRVTNYLRHCFPLMPYFYSRWTILATLWLVLLFLINCICFWCLIFYSLWAYLSWLKALLFFRNFISELYNASTFINNMKYFLLAQKKYMPFESSFYAKNNLI